MNCVKSVRVFNASPQVSALLQMQSWRRTSVATIAGTTATPAATPTTTNNTRTVTETVDADTVAALHCVHHNVATHYAPSGIPPTESPCWQAAVVCDGATRIMPKRVRCRRTDRGATREEVNVCNGPKFGPDIG